MTLNAEWDLLLSGIWKYSIFSLIYQTPFLYFFYSFKCAPLSFPHSLLFLSLPLSLSTPAKYVSQPIYNKLSFSSNWISSLAAFVGWVTPFSLIIFLFYPKMMYCITRISPFPARFSSLQPTRALNLVLAMESNYTLSEGCIFDLLKSPKSS